MKAFPKKNILTPYFSVILMFPIYKYSVILQKLLMFRSSHAQNKTYMNIHATYLFYFDDYCSVGC